MKKRKRQTDTARQRPNQRKIPARQTACQSFVLWRSREKQRQRGRTKPTATGTPSRQSRRNNRLNISCLSGHRRRDHLFTLISSARPSTYSFQPPEQLIWKRLFMADFYVRHFHIRDRGLCVCVCVSASRQRCACVALHFFFSPLQHSSLLNCVCNRSENK